MTGFYYLVICQIVLVKRDNKKDLCRVYTSFHFHFLSHVVHNEWVNLYLVKKNRLFPFQPLL